MKVIKSKSKNTTIYYLAKSVWKNGKSATTIVEKIGTDASIKKQHKCKDAYEWAKKYAKKRTAEEAHAPKAKIILNENKSLKAKDYPLNAGAIIINKIFCEFGLDKIFDKIRRRENLKFDLTKYMLCSTAFKIIYPHLSYYSDEYYQFLGYEVKYNEGLFQDVVYVLTKYADFIQKDLWKHYFSKKANLASLLYDEGHYLFPSLYSNQDKKDFSTRGYVRYENLSDADFIPFAFKVDIPFYRDVAKQQDVYSSDFLENLASSLRDINVLAEEETFLQNEKVSSIFKHVDYFRNYDMQELDSDTLLKALDGKNWNVPRSEKLMDFADINFDAYQNSCIAKELPWEDGASLPQRYCLYSIKHMNEKIQLMYDNVVRLFRKSNTNIYRGITSKKKQEEFNKRLNKSLKNYISSQRLLDGYFCFESEIPLTTDQIINLNCFQHETYLNCSKILADYVYSGFDIGFIYRIYSHFVANFITSIVSRMLCIRVGYVGFPESLCTGLASLNFRQVDSQHYVPLFCSSPILKGMQKEFGIKLDSEVLTKEQLKKWL